MLDGYWEYRLKPWDVCAGALIVEEAGGAVTTTDGLAFSPFARSILATNGNEKLTGAIREQTGACVRVLRVRVCVRACHVCARVRVHFDF